MSFTGNIRKIFIISLWGLIGVAVLILLVAAIKARNDKACQGFAIEINGETKGHWFIDKKDIVERLTAKGVEQIKGRKLKSFDLRKMEDRLEKEPWIKDAELFFDNNEILRVKVTERIPVARMFTINGQSFYIDATGRRLPLSDKQSARLPVFTGFPSDKTKLKKADSILLQQAKNLGNYILNDPFWMAQIAQVDITPSHNFELVPTVGNHIIEFGDGTDAEKKFARLMLFYKQVLSKVGMNRYEKINIQYNKQVIGIKKAVAVSKADSLKATRNIEQMILEARSLQQQLAAADTLKVLNKNASEPTIDPSPVKTQNPAVENNLSGGTKTVASQKIQSMKNRPYEARAKKDHDSRKPKAVMPKN